MSLEVCLGAEANMLGLYKIISKMGIATINSYRSAQLFETVGLHGERLTVGGYLCSCDGRRSGAGAAQDDDGGDQHGGAVTHHVGSWYRLRGDALHRRVDGGRDDFFHGVDLGSNSGHLCAD